MAVSIRPARGTRAAFDALVGSNALVVGQLYVITNEGWMAVATGTSTYIRVGGTTVTEGTGVSVNNTDPFAPVVALSSGAQASLALADTAVQPGALAAVATSGSATDLTTGTVPFARIPTGSTGTTVTVGNDSRLSDAREWTAATVGQAEAEAGTATTRRAWTAQRVAQAIAALGGFVADGAVTFAKMASGAVATFAEFNSATASKLLSTASVWSSQISLTDGATIAVDLNTGYDFQVTLGGNRTLGAPSNVRHGKKGVVWVSAATATRTLTLNGAWVLATGIETGPYEITTSQRLGVCYVCDGSTVRVTGIVRYG